MCMSAGIVSANKTEEVRGFLWFLRDMDSSGLFPSLHSVIRNKLKTPNMTENDFIQGKNNQIYFLEIIFPSLRLRKISAVR